MDQKFDWLNATKNQLRERPFVWGLCLMTMFRYYLAAQIPLGNDEAYYWDWGRQLQLSYIDHPPGVAVLSYLSQQLFAGLLAARGLVPLIHLAATILLLGAVLVFLGRGLRSSEKTLFFAFTQFVPVFSLGGILLMPDVGLLLGLSLALLCGLLIVTNLNRSWIAYFGLGGGVALGLAFKYHGVPLGGGLLLGTLWGVRMQLRQELPKWTLAVVVGAMGAIPVLAWNWQHDWVSFVFQSSHGFGKLEINPRYTLQALGGLIVFLTPFFFWALGKGLVGMARHWKDGSNLLLLLGAGPLLGLLLVLSSVKQVLPHWFVPSLWLLIPIGIGAVQVGRFYQWNKIAVILLTILVPISLASSPLRNKIVALTGHQPGGLGELTMWRDVQSALTQLAPEALVGNRSSRCPAVTLGSLRWFWVAQMSHQLPGHPKIVSFDLNRLSYYSFRDQLGDLVGCKITIIGSKKHYDREALQNFLEIDSEQEVVLESHKDRVAVVLRGTVLKAPQSIRATYY